MIPQNAYHYSPGTVLTVGSHRAVIKKYISEGGYAHVYTVDITPSYNGSSVACLKRVAVPDKVTLNILRAEVDAMKRLKGHRYIVSYIDSHAARMSTGVGYEVFVLMEYCSGNGLIDFMNTRLVNKLTEPEILKIMSDITEALCIMHALNPPLIHRDIKIENVLISGNGDYKLCDFGSASGVLRPPKNIEEFKILQEDIMRHTTAQYRAPEMIDLYKGFPIDEKSDIWAMGVFLYKLCYYTTPFENNSLNGNGHAGNGGADLAILNAKFSFPLKPVYSSRLKNVIKILLTPDPRLRPTAHQLLEEICKIRNVPVPAIKKKENAPALPKRKIQSSSSSPITAATTASTATSATTTSTATVAQAKPSPPVPSKDPFASIDRSKVLNSNSTSISAPSADKNKKITSTKSKVSLPHVNSLPEKSAYFDGHRYISTETQTDQDGFIRPRRISPSTSSPPNQQSQQRTSQDLKRSPPNQLNHHRRPVSMYVSDNYKTYSGSSDNMEILKNKITGSMETVELSPGSNQYIQSNIEFLRNLNRQDSGKSWRPQKTGDSISSRNGGGSMSRNNTGLRRISTGSQKIKRNSISSIKSIFTGDKKEKKSASSSRHASSTRVNEMTEHSFRSNDSSSTNGATSINNNRSTSADSHSVYSSTSSSSGSSFRKSSDSILEIPEKETSQSPVRKTVNSKTKASDPGFSKIPKTGSIQKRVQMLLNRKQDPPPVKTATGYGKYTSSEDVSTQPHTTSSSTTSSKSENSKFKKPEVKVGNVSSLTTSYHQQQQLSLSKNSTASTNATITPQSTYDKPNYPSNQTTPKIVSSKPQMSPLSAKNPPPPKPKKPEFLKSPNIVQHRTNHEVRKTLSPKADSGGLRISTKKEANGRRFSNTSDLSIDVDVDDLERQFSLKFPSAV